MLDAAQRSVSMSRVRETHHFVVSEESWCVSRTLQDYHEAISIEGGELRVDSTSQAELVEFANLWMRNWRSSNSGGSS